MSHAEVGEVELLPVPDKTGMLFIFTADNCCSTAGEGLANHAESGVSS
jgi:hypothetical protein